MFEWLSNRPWVDRCIHQAWMLKWHLKLRRSRYIASHPREYHFRIALCAAIIHFMLGGIFGASLLRAWSPAVNIALAAAAAYCGLVFPMVLVARSPVFLKRNHGPWVMIPPGNAQRVIVEQNEQPPPAFDLDVGPGTPPHMSPKRRISAASPSVSLS